MLDPVTIISTATVAFKGLKQLVESGRELTDCMTQLSQWAGAISDLDKSEELIRRKKDSLFRSLLPTNGKSIQAQAMEAFAAKQTARKQREELRQLIQYTTGKQGWEEFMRMETQIRKDRQKALYAEIERKEKLKELLLGALIVIAGIATMGLAIFLAYAIKNAP
jgi:DNA-binding FrmR family transcriptional regulator